MNIITIAVLTIGVMGMLLGASMVSTIFAQPNSDHARKGTGGQTVINLFPPADHRIDYNFKPQPREPLGIGSAVNGHIP